MTKTLIILRGIPGSGKSTFASAIGGVICTADDYHMKDGKYDWKPENGYKAHLACQKKAEEAMAANEPMVIIANTNTTSKEMKPYYALADKYRYRVFSVIVENRHNGINEHNVPDESLKKMRERFDIKL